MTSLTYNQLWHRLTPLYEPHEAQAVVRTVLDELFGMTLTDIVCGSVECLPAARKSTLTQAMRRLETGEPVQYVLGVAHFCGRRFRMEPGVLIPRPETEELCKIVEALITPLFRGRPQLPILDVGTGSGCIAITLALDMPGAEVEAWDISPTALRIANANAKTLRAPVTFRLQDALNPPPAVPTPAPASNGLPENLPYAAIVSNPPYIAKHERATMESNVLSHEPPTALFVPDDDPLRFYRAIAQYARHALRPNGWLCFEINPLYADDLRLLLADLGFKGVEIRYDQFGKRRFAVAAQPTGPA